MRVQALGFNQGMDSSLSVKVPILSLYLRSNLFQYSLRNGDFTPAMFERMRLSRKRTFAPGEEEKGGRKERKGKERKGGREGLRIKSL